MFLVFVPVQTLSIRKIDIDITGAPLESSGYCLHKVVCLISLWRCGKEQKHEKGFHTKKQCGKSLMMQMWWMAVPFDPRKRKSFDCTTMALLVLWGRGAQPVLVRGSFGTGLLDEFAATKCDWQIEQSICMKLIPFLFILSSLSEQFVFFFNYKVLSITSISGSTCLTHMIHCCSIASLLVQEKSVLH